MVDEYTDELLSIVLDDALPAGEDPSLTNLSVAVGTGNSKVLTEVGLVLLDAEVVKISSSEVVSIDAVGLENNVVETVVCITVISEVVISLVVATSSLVVLISTGIADVSVLRSSVETVEYTSGI